MNGKQGEGGSSREVLLHWVSASAGSGKTRRIVHEFIKLLEDRLMDHSRRQILQTLRHVLFTTFSREATANLRRRILEEIESRIQAGKDSADPKEWRQIYSLLVSDPRLLQIGTLDSFLVQVTRHLNPALYTSDELIVDEVVLKRYLRDRLLVHYLLHPNSPIGEYFSKQIEFQRQDPDSSVSPLPTIMNNILSKFLDLLRQKASLSSSDEDYVLPDSSNHSHHVHLQRCLELTAKFQEWILQELQNLQDQHHLPSLLLFQYHWNLSRDSAITDTPDLLDIIIFEHFREFNYIFLDEAQDTSHFQLAFLFHLARVSTQLTNRSVTIFAVGDPKQSIYQWRGAIGNPEPIFQEHACMNPAPPLRFNYRSCRKIVETNNFIFQKLPEYLERWMRHVAKNFSQQQNSTSSIEKFIEQVSTKIQETYQDVVQCARVPNHHSTSTCACTVCFKLFSPDSGRRENISPELYIDSLVETIQTLINKHKVKPSEIWILVRNHKQAIQLHRLLSEFQIPCSTAKTHSLMNLPGFRLVFTILAYIVTRSPVYLSESLHLLSLLNPGMRNHPQEGISRLQAIQREFWQHFPAPQKGELPIDLEDAGLLILSLLHSWLENEFPPGEWKFVRTEFQRILHSLKQSGIHSIQAMIYLLDFRTFPSPGIDIEKLLSLPPVHTDAVQIRTIHDVKGLQAEAVLIPPPDDPFVQKNWAHPLLRVSSDGMSSRENDQVGAILAEIGEKKRRSSRFGELAFLIPHAWFQNPDTQTECVIRQIHDQLAQKTLEEINLMYVAFTRARRFLYVWLPKCENTQVSRKSSSQSLPFELYLLKNFSPAHVLSYLVSDMREKLCVEELSPRSLEPDSVSPRMVQIQKVTLNSTPSRDPGKKSFVSFTEFIPNNLDVPEPSDSLQATSSPRWLLGVNIHHLMRELLEKFSPLTPLDEVLKQWKQLKQPHSEIPQEAQMLWTQMQKCLQRNLSRNAQDAQAENLEWFPELPLYHPEHGVVRPDLIVLFKVGQSLQRILVLDFKTYPVGSSSTSRHPLPDSWIHQMKKYCEALKKRYFPGLQKRISAYLILPDHFESVVEKNTAL